MILKNHLSGIAVCLLFSCFVQAHPTTLPATNPTANAALKYWIAFAEMPQTPADLAIIASWKTAPLDDNAIKLIKESDVCLASLHAGAQIPHCDWGIDLNEGMQLRLPYLPKLRSLTRLACLRARYELQQGQQAAAVEDLCDAMACARHGEVDPIIIFKLSRYVLDHEAIDLLAPELGRFNPQVLVALSSRLNHLPTPVSLSAVMLEQENIGKLLVDRIQAAGPTPDWAVVFPSSSSDEHSSEKIVKLCGGTSESVVQQVKAIESYYEDFAKLLSGQPTQQEYHQKYPPLLARAKANPLANVVLPVQEFFFDYDAAAQTRLLLLQAAVNVLQHGPRTLDGLKDPVNQQPIEYLPRTGGFSLNSKVTDREKPVALSVTSGQ